MIRSFISQIILAIIFTVVTSTPISDYSDRSQFLILRTKRNANRAMTFSGFNPNGAMTAFASSADFPSTYFYQYALPPQLPPAVDARNFYKKPVVVPSQSELATPAPSSNNESPPPQLFVPDNKESTVANGQETKFSDNNDINNNNNNALADSSGQSVSSEPIPNANEQDPTVLPSPSPKKGKKKPVVTTEEDDDDEPQTGKANSRASSSFNAWFPIMLGMYPGNNNGLPASGAGASVKESESNPGGRERGYGTTIIANSVSNGKSGVAHAIAYGGSPAGPFPSFGGHQQKDAAGLSY